MDTTKQLRPKGLWASYGFWSRLGLLGGHRFYLKQYTLAIIFLLTGGGAGIRWLIDGIRMKDIVKNTNNNRGLGNIIPQDEEQLYKVLAIIGIIIAISIPVGGIIYGLLTEAFVML